MDQNNAYAEASLLCAIFMIVVAVIGVITNATTVRIFTHRSLVSSINTLLAGLAVVDAALLISGVPLYSSVAIFSYMTSVSNDATSVDRLEKAIAYMTVYVYPFTSIFQTASVFTMVVITIERWIAVCFPLKARTACTWRRAVLALIIINTLSVLYNFSRFWEWETCTKNVSEIDSNGTAYTKETMEVVPALRGNKNYMNVYGHWMYFIFLFALPFFVLVLLNSLVVNTIRKATQFRASLTRTQCKEHATATMLVIVAIVFLSCNALAFILNGMDVFGFSTFNTVESAVTPNNPNRSNGSADETAGQLASFTPLFYFLIDLNNLLVMVHCSSNFFIYLAFSKRFREYFFILSPCCYFRKSPAKSTLVFERDPLSNVSAVKKRSCLVASYNENRYELELLPNASSLTPACTKNQREASFGNDSLEHLITQHPNIEKVVLRMEE